MSGAPRPTSLHLPAALPPRARNVLQTSIAAPVVLFEMVTLGSTLFLLARHIPGLQEPLTHAWCRQVLFWGGVDLSVEGTQNVDPEARYVFISNHQSHMDVPCIISALPTRVRFIAKRSLFKIPVFGQALRAIGTVDIDRRDRADTLRRLHDAQRGVGQRCSLHFFAEGTRSPDGRLLPFKKGAAAMALALQVPLVPVALVGTRKIFPKGAMTTRTGRALVHIGRPISVGPEDTVEERHRLLRLARAEVVAMLAAHGEPVDETGGGVEEVVGGG
jgi:1-acyl-sn-glycerol-3-phosphate acyltransferase